MKDFNTVGGRRFLICLGACIMTTILMWFLKIDSKTYGDVVIWITGIYVTGNVAQRAGGAIPDVFSKVTDNFKGNKNPVVDKTASTSTSDQDAQ